MDTLYASHRVWIDQAIIPDTPTNIYIFAFGGATTVSTCREDRSRGSHLPPAVSHYCHHWWSGPQPPRHQCRQSPQPWQQAPCGPRLLWQQSLRTYEEYIKCTLHKHVCMEKHRKYEDYIIEEFSDSEDRSEDEEKEEG